MFWNIGRILFSSSIPLSKENTLYSGSVFQSGIYGTIGEKEELLRKFTENREIFSSGEVQKQLQELDQNLMLFSDRLLMLVCSLYRTMTLWQHQMQKMSSMLCINTPTSGFNYADENQMVWYLAVQCFFFFQICPRFSHRDLSNTEGLDSSSFSLLPWFSVSLQVCGQSL